MYCSLRSTVQTLASLFAVYKMSEEPEYRCFIGGLAWATSDRSLKEAFDKYGKLIEAKVVMDKFSGRSRGFGFVTFDDKKAMEEAIEEMNGIDLDGRTITVDKAQPHQGSGRDYDGDRGRDRGGRDRDRGRDYGGGGRGSGGGGDCFKCGKPGHFARECPSEVSRGGGGGRYGVGADAAGSLVLVVVQALEAIVLAVTALVHMSVGGQGVSVLDRIIALDSAYEWKVLLNCLSPSALH
ncbi:hypothetical protein ACLB2K_057316 [Fragaria x ananassa]